MARNALTLNFLSAIVLLFSPTLTVGQTPPASPSSDKASENRTYPWRDSVRFGDGLSVGGPRAVMVDGVAPTSWCLTPVHRSTGDLGLTGSSWMDGSRQWLLQVLSDTTDLGIGWRRQLGGAPELSDRDTLVQVMDEVACHTIADSINTAFLGWENGPPPVVAFRFAEFIVAYPANVQLGEFGLAVGLSPSFSIKGASTW